MQDVDIRADAREGEAADEVGLGLVLKCPVPRPALVVRLLKQDCDAPGPPQSLRRDAVPSRGRGD